MVTTMVRARATVVTMKMMQVRIVSLLYTVVKMVVLTG